ncbi:Na+/H+ antiporter subunit D [Promicromonospora thailandica]|uniref:Multicomponent Na+:H+ antiporter subunit D n=1 Tax=Promicromonospora thailandica TaxID=765201 RepID=A0A9X2G3F0_9MICO|nr:Na+/H+ antiporter subunit D [Promicromonospora thailandica]MCP2266159.1 multicomponent Na+:H+ antiporter subunit D [Promicromonospora thailandica]BFF20635.1 Na+/H+ antiporter subunit D [Promicromonospora thailandica]
MNLWTVQTLVPLPVLVPLFAAGLALALHRHERAQRIISVVALSVAVAAAAGLVVAAHDGPVVNDLGGWAAPVGVNLVADPLAAIMLLVSSIMLLCVLLYSMAQGIADGDGRTAPAARGAEELRRTLEAQDADADESGRRDVLPVAIFHPTFLVLAAGVADAFLAGDLFNLYVGFEILLAASYVLLTLGGTSERIRAGSVYVVVALLSSIVFLLAVGLTYAATGTVNMAQLAERLPDVDPGVRLGIQTMLLLAFGIKAAIFPLSAWLPDSYPTAPAPVTAVFAGLLTKVGVYAILRTQTMLFPHDEKLEAVLLVLALATMLVGILGAVAQDDVKRLLSFTLVSHIGYMIFGVALATQASTAAAIFYVVHHITVQTALFLVVGLIERRSGTTSLERLGGLATMAPGLAVLFFVPAMNLAGIPPLSGFLGKVGLLEAGVLDGSVLAWILVVGSVVTSLLTLYAVIRAWNKAFWQPCPDKESLPAPAPLPGGMVGPTAALVAVGVSLTVLAGPLYEYADRAAGMVMDGSTYVDAVFPDGARRGTGESNEVRDEVSSDVEEGTP